MKDNKNQYENFDFDELKKNLEKVDVLTKRLVFIIASKSKKQQITQPNQDLYYKAAAKYFSEILSNPSKLIENQVKYYKSSLETWSDVQRYFLKQENNNSKKNDKRFRSVTWEENPYFKMIKQQYLTSSDIIQETITGIDGLSHPEQKQITFFTKQMLEFFSPTNFLMTNPDALQEAMETKGQSLVNGLENLVDDLEKNDGEFNVSLTDETAFEIGKNIANAEGSVIYENKLYQLIYYKPTQEISHQIPILIIPPWINKFYILDLKPENSFIKFLLSKGIPVFLMSWVNPDSSHSEIGYDDYLKDGLLDAIEQTRRFYSVDLINSIGYCIGGTLLATGLSYLNARKLEYIKSASFFTTLTDFEDPGDLSIFVSDEYLNTIKDQIDDLGFMDGDFLSQTFSFLRSNDLIYGPAVKSYLMGKKPPPFDLLYWNSDSTNLPGKMALEYLEKFYKNNDFSKGKLEVLGEKVNLEQISQPIIVIGTFNDHIAPWKSSFNGLSKTSGEKVFILAGSGHIAGIINPEHSNKYGYWINNENYSTPEKWFNSSINKNGSWWNEWYEWKKQFLAEKIISTKMIGITEIEPAPGRYVKKKNK
ncbi:class I poly(R)-hydroxyalkanoic acid synthase [Alphaproteobacteria bacterium]|nr:class I poly(R)-hydroxyalkanoic acid synthase [Alphaproteobacteria bacterium]